MASPLGVFTIRKEPDVGLLLGSHWTRLARISHPARRRSRTTRFGAVLEFMEGRSLLSVGLAGPLLGHPHAPPASPMGHDQGESHLQPGDNLPGSPPGPTSGGGGPADQGNASPLGNPAGPGPQPGNANQGIGPAGNPHQPGDPTGNPHTPGDPTGNPDPPGGPAGTSDPPGGPAANPGPLGGPAGNPHTPGDSTGNPHQPGDPTGNPHESGGPAANPDPPGGPAGDPQGDGPQGTGPDPGGPAVGNPQVGSNQGSENGGGTSLSIGPGNGNGNGNVGVGSVGASPGRGSQNSGGPGRASEDGTASGGGLSGQSGSSHQDASGHAAQHQPDAAPTPDATTSAAAVASQPATAREEGGVTGPVATPTPTTNPAGPQAATADRETVSEVGSLQMEAALSSTSGPLSSPIGTLGPAMSQVGGSLVATSPGGLPAAGGLRAGLANADERPESRPHNAGQGGNLNPAVVMQGARRGGSPEASAETPAPAEQDTLGRLSESLPIDLAALDRAFEHCLGQIDAMGETLADLLDSDGAWPWLMAGVVATTAGTVAFLRSRKDRFDPLALATGDGTTSSWFLETLSRA